MARPTVYIETSVFSYLAARPSRDVRKLAKQEYTWSWWAVDRNKYALYTSSAVLGEISLGDPDAAAARLRYAVDIPSLEITGDVEDVTDLLIATRAVPAVARTDATHIAVAAVQGMDYLLTWNCAHINNAMQRKKINEVLSALGRGKLVMVTPEELEQRWMK